MAALFAGGLRVGTETEPTSRRGYVREKKYKEEKLNRVTKSDLACRAPVHRNEKNICEARELLVLLHFARAFDNGLRLLMRRVQLAYLSRSIILKRGSNVMTEY